MLTHEIKIVFWGSDEFAAVNLEALIRANFKVSACVTHPDKPKGRGLSLACSPVKEIAGRNQIPVFQPANLDDQDFQETLRQLRSDLFVVIAYGQFLPSEVLAIPRLFSINAHASLLPRYRGAAPVNWAIITGESKTGVTIIKMNERMDAGEIVARDEMDIDPEETAVSLRAKLALLSAKCLCQTIDDLEYERFTLEPQDEKRVSFAPKLKKVLGIIDWKKSARQLHDLVRGLQPWPSAYSFYQDKMVKIIESSMVAAHSYDHVPGEVISLSQDGLLVATGQGGLLITLVHPESSRCMDAHSFAIGHGLTVGDVLGSRQEKNG